MTSQPDVDPLLPLPAATLHILLALAEGDRHGYAILQEVNERSGGTTLHAGTLYTSIRRLVEQALVVEVDQRQLKRAPPGTDGRRRYYRLTPLGRRVARLEIARLGELVRIGQRAGLLGGRS